jgi:hypothetical protein
MLMGGATRMVTRRSEHTFHAGRILSGTREGIWKTVYLITTFTLRLSFLNTLHAAPFTDHGMPVHKLQRDLPPVWSCMDIQGKPPVITQQDQKTGQDRVSPVLCKNGAPCRGCTMSTRAIKRSQLIRA